MDYIENEVFVNHEDQTIPFKGEWEAGEIVLLSETTQAWEDKHAFSHVWNLKKKIKMTQILKRDY